MLTKEEIDKLSEYYEFLSLEDLNKNNDEVKNYLPEQFGR